MSKDTAISWTTHTFNTHWGCTEISEGCAHCYARALATMWGHDVWGDDKPRRLFGPKHWNEPLKWNADAAASREPTWVFTSSMADVFEDRRDLDSTRAQLAQLIDATPALTWLLLTKRVDVMLDRWMWPAHSPPPNVVAGCTVENQRRADERIPLLLQVPARKRFLSVEPLLERVDLGITAGTCACCPRAWGRWVRLPRRVRGDWMYSHVVAEAGVYKATTNQHGALAVSTPHGDLGIKPAEFEPLHVDWIVVGGESGARRRACEVAWIADVVAQADAARVPVHVKQDGGLHPGKQGRIPDDLWVKKARGPLLRVLPTEAA